MNRIVSGARLRLRLQHIDEIELAVIRDQINAGIEAIAFVAFCLLCAVLWVVTP